MARGIHERARRAVRQRHPYPSPTASCAAPARTARTSYSGSSMSPADCRSARTAIKAKDGGQALLVRHGR